MIRLAKHYLRYGGRFERSYASWEDAKARADGYEQTNIVDQAFDAALATKNNGNVFERDGQIVDHADVPYPLIAVLLRAALKNNGEVRVLDFGGAFGTSYFQCRPWLQELKHIRWCVVEQAHYVQKAKEGIADDVLSFADSIETAYEQGEYDVVLCSGVLQYVASPEQIFQALLKHKPPFVVIDRTPVTAKAQDSIAVQKQSSAGLPPSSYPVRLFAEQSLHFPLQQGYKIESQFEALDPPMGSLRRKVTFKGIIFARY